MSGPLFLGHAVGDHLALDRNILMQANNLCILTWPLFLTLSGLYVCAGYMSGISVNWLTFKEEVLQSTDTIILNSSPSLSPFNEMTLQSC